MPTHAPLARPLLVLMSGAPGSGKTTLARLLSQKMGLYHLERDSLKLGIEFTSHSSPANRSKTVVPIYFELVANMLALRISIIADGSHYAGKTEKDLQRFGAVATVVNIHCHAANHHERFLRRVAAEAHEQPGWLPEHLPDITAIYQQTREPLAHGYETLEVDTTTEEYEPSLAVIVAWIMARAR